MERLNRAPHAARPRGLAIIETALLLPILLLVVFGLLEYGWIFYKSKAIDNAARHGCRIGVTAASTQNQVLTGIDTLMTSANMAQGTSGYTVALSADPGSLNKGELFTVTITVPYANVELIGIPLIPVPSDLQGATTMVKE